MENYLYTKKCDYCGTIIKTNRKLQRFCSVPKKCRDFWWARLLKKSNEIVRIPVKDMDRIKIINIYPSILGRAGELRIASELLLRGFDVSLMLVDSGADLILTNGNKIQVKSSRLRYVNLKNTSAHYIYSFKGWKRDKSGKRKQQIHKLDNIDFVILWAVDDDVFFIIPANKIRGKLSINIYPKRREHYLNKFKNKWDLLKK